MQSSHAGLARARARRPGLIASVFDRVPATFKDPAPDFERFVQPHNLDSTILSGCPVLPMHYLQMFRQDTQTGWFREVFQTAGIAVFQTVEMFPIRARSRSEDAFSKPSVEMNGLD